MQPNFCSRRAFRDRESWTSESRSATNPELTMSINAACCTPCYSRIGARIIILIPEALPQPHAALSRCALSSAYFRNAPPRRALAHTRGQEGPNGIRSFSGRLPVATRQFLRCQSFLPFPPSNPRFPRATYFSSSAVSFSATFPLFVTPLLSAPRSSCR